MTMYEYSGRDRSGRRVDGRFDARTEAEARQVLRLMGVSEAKINGGSAKTSTEIKLPEFMQKWNQNRGVKDSDLVTFTKQLSVMIDAGVSVVKALELLGAQASNPTMRNAIGSLRGKVERGLELSDSMQAIPAIFDELYCSLVRAGTASGQLDVILKRLSQYIEKNAKLKRQLFSAMFYPSIVLTIALALTVFMLVVIVPMLASTFLEGGKELPGLTQAVISVSNLLRDNFLYLIGALAGSVYFFKKWIATPTGRYQWDSFLLRIPLVGTLVLKISIARFASTCSTLVASGVGITDVLQTAQGVLGNKLLEESIGRVREGVIQGKGMGLPMSQEKFFPPMVTSMVSIGEASGRLDAMLEKVSEFYEEEVDVAMAALLKAIEPAMFVFIGGVVGVILIAMYLPVFDLASVGG
ncbi:MAG: type II secretion system F family protein [Betaproteobacteria bacterium]|nr:type II secretion system F family protein [Betaproteobacteria bacterium]